MDGPLLVIKAWVFVLAVTFVYRRWFERAGPRVPEFEALCASRPLLVAIKLLDQSAMARVVAALSRRHSAVPTHGGWPWPNYALELEVEAHDCLVLVRTRRATLLKTHGAKPPALIALVRELAESEQIWLCPELYWAEHPPPGGWRLPRDSARPAPLSKAPIWLSRGLRETAPDRRNSRERAARCVSRRAA